MSYKIKNGEVWVLYNNQWWQGDILFTIYPDLKNNKLQEYRS